MKLIFFLVAFGLVCFRVFIAWSGKDRAMRGESTANIEISSGSFKEEIKYYGKIVLNDEETGFRSISPGGYVKFHINDTSVTAESNLKGDIDYHVYEDKREVTDQAGIKNRVALAIREMLSWGFDADNRMERVFSRGGTQALLNQVDSVHSDQMKRKYLERVLTIDSLSVEDRRTLIKKMASVDSDLDKADLLNKISMAQLRDSEANEEYFQAIESVRSDLDRFNVLRHVIDQDSLPEKNINRIMTIAGHSESELDKANIFSTLIQKGVIQGDHLDRLLVLIAGLPSGLDKANLYRAVCELKHFTEPQWIGLINSIAQLDSDLDKAQLLTEIAGKMPKTEQVKTAFHLAAKTINNDMDYGRVMRAGE
jgi:hypothetical protein